MPHFKEELHGIITLALAVKEADGVLLKGAKVKLTGNNEVGKISATGDTVFGYVLVANKVAGGDATIVTRGKKFCQETTGAAYPVGSLLGVNNLGKAIKATPGNASGTITVLDFTWAGTETITINGVVLTVGTDFTAATSNNATALSIANAINAKVPGVKATVNAAVVTVTAINPGLAGNSITTATSDVGDDVTVEQANLAGGSEFLPFAIAIEASTGADESRYALWF